LFRIRNERDDEAWSLFLETYAPVVYRYCRRRGLQDSDAADVTQEVMTQVARSVSGFDYDPERGRFRDWLFRIVYNRLADHLRVAQRPLRSGSEGLGDQDELATTGTDSDWGEEFNAQVYRAALARVRDHFEEASWRAFELTWVEGRPASEAARTLGVSVDSVYVAKSRVLKRLREEVIALADDLPVYTPLR
jgi:RNA polymerase sigma-70 factor (ECF subfamily)